MPKVTVSVGYNTASTHSLSETLDYQIGQLKSKEGLTTSSSLKVEKNNGEIIPTKLYSNVCYEYEIVDESNDIKHGFIWDNEKGKSTDRRHLSQPLISSGDMESTPLPANNPHGVQFSLHKYHHRAPGKRSPLTREEILRDMHPNLESLGKHVIRLHQVGDPRATNYSEIQTKIKPSPKQRITSVVFNAEPGSSRFPLDYLFQGRNKQQSYTPSQQDFQNLMVFQAALVQSEFFKNNINQDNTIIPMYKRVYDPRTKTVRLEACKTAEILAALNHLNTVNGNSFVQHITKSSHQGNDLHSQLVGDLKKLPELIKFYEAQLQKEQHASQQKTHLPKTPQPKSPSIHPQAKPHPTTTGLKGYQLFTDNRHTTKHKPCYEISCKTQEQAKKIASLLKQQNIRVFESVQQNKFWRIKFENTPNALQVAKRIINSNMPQHLQKGPPQPRVNPTQRFKGQLQNIIPYRLLINQLDHYKNERNGPMFGLSKTEKFKAVDALKNALNGHQQEDLSQYLSVLRDGNLGKSIREILKKTDTTPFLGKRLSTVSSLVAHLDEQFHSTKRMKP